MAFAWGILDLEGKLHKHQIKRRRGCIGRWTGHVFVLFHICYSVTPAGEDLDSQGQVTAVFLGKKRVLSCMMHFCKSKWIRWTNHEPFSQHLSDLRSLKANFWENSSCWVMNPLAMTNFKNKVWVILLDSFWWIAWLCSMGYASMISDLVFFWNPTTSTSKYHSRTSI